MATAQVDVPAALAWRDFMVSDYADAGQERRLASKGGGLRELDGVWTNREVTAMKEIRHRVLVLDGGPVGIEMARAVSTSAVTWP